MHGRSVIAYPQSLAAVGQATQPSHPLPRGLRPSGPLQAGPCPMTHLAPARSSSTLLPPAETPLMRQAPAGTPPAGLLEMVAVVMESIAALEAQMHGRSVIAYPKSLAAVGQATQTSHPLLRGLRPSGPLQAGPCRMLLLALA